MTTKASPADPSECGAAAIQATSNDNNNDDDDDDDVNVKESNRRTSYHAAGFVIFLVAYALFQYFVPISAMINGWLIPVAAILSIVWGCYASKHSTSLALFGCFGVFFTVGFGIFTVFSHWPPL